MKETALWRRLDPELSKIGKFQKISDKFTGGIPDVLGCITRGVALELKELKGVRVIRTKFRPGQLDWLGDWELAGGLSLIVATHRLTWYAFPVSAGEPLESGVSDLEDLALWIHRGGKEAPRNFCDWMKSVL